MNAMALLTNLADRWDISLGLALLGVYALLPWWRSRTAALAVPLFGLLLRKVLLFVPVCGAASTCDQVLFWHLGAIVFHLLILGFFVLCFACARLPRTQQGEEMVGCVVMAAMAALVAGAYLLLPVDGWGILTLPVVAVFGTAKLLLVSPLFLPACCIGIALQSATLFWPRRLSGRLVNLTLISGVVLAGFAGVAGQGVALLPGGQPAPVVSMIREAPYRGRMPVILTEPDTWLRTRSSLGGKLLFGAKRSDYPINFLWLWRAQLPVIARTGVHLVEKEIAPDDLPRLASTPAGVTSLLALGVALLALAGLAAFAERFTRPLRPSPSVAGSNHAAPLLASHRRELAASVHRFIAKRCIELDRKEDIQLRLSFGPGALAVLLIGAIVPAVLPRWSFLPYIEGTGDILIVVAGFALVLGVALELALLVSRVFLVPEEQAAVAAFLAGDRGGRPSPPRSLIEMLGEMASDPRLGEQVLVGQPVPVLLACLRHPTDALRRQALWLLPVHQPPTEVGRLVISGQVEARAFVAKHPACPRPDRWQLAHDPEFSVRAAALSQLAPVSPGEIAMLARARWADVRVFAVNQPGVPRALIRRLCGDADGAVSHAAFAQFALEATPDELRDLVIGTGAWVALAAHPLTPPERVAGLLALHVRMQYVIDQPAQGYESTSGTYGEETTWVQTQAEIGHQEYRAEDLALAQQILGREPTRRQAVLAKLAELNGELGALLGVSQV